MEHEPSVITKFWSKVIKTNSCWLWTGTKIRAKPDMLEGYGQFYYKGGSVRAHRFSYELSKGKISAGLTIDHLCRRPPCVNPDHLEAVTPRENILRGEGRPAKNYQKTHCINGHEFTEANTLRYRGGWRGCLQCRRKCSRDWRLRHKKAIS